MEFNHLKYQYSSRRNSVYGKNGMVATSSPLAAEAGMEILKKGGNAIDAAVATAAMLTVVEPSANGIGGDLFSIFWHEGKLHGMNSSGHAPELMTIENIKKKGYEEEISKFGLDPVTVPGIPKGWANMVNNYGNLTLEEVLEPAAKIAETGYTVSGAAAYMFNRAYKNYSKQLEKYPILKTWFDVYEEDGRTKRAGEIIVLKDHARALREIGKTDGKSFYEGKIADDIDKLSRENGGFIRKEDLMKFESEMVNPLSTNYKGYDIWEIPPNGIGIIALMGLNILENLDLSERESIDTYHKQIESLKLAFSDGKEYIADLDHMNVQVSDMLSKSYAKERAALINEEAMDPKSGELPISGTVYLATADGDGNMVSLIQSCYTGFGSGVVLPGWGISLHNRGNQFTLKEGKANSLEPNKRPYHTIIPGFITKDGKAIGPFGIMGGPMQPQAHMQVVSNLIDYNMNPQDALDAPRWQWEEGKKVIVEKSVPSHIVEGLMHKGHDISVARESLSFGRGQVIIRNEHGALIGGTEPRTDGYIATW